MRSMRSCHKVGLVAAGVLSGLAASTGSYALDYPTRPVHLMVATNPGGLNDILGRIFAEKLQEEGGQPVIVENNAKGLGMIGSRAVAGADPDGYSLLVGNPANIVIRPALSANPSYQTDAFVPVALFGSVGSVLLVNKTLPVNSLQELLDVAKATPGTVTFASQGVAASGHMAAAQFMAVTGTELVHVPYRGAPMAMSALLGGHVSMLFDTARADVAEQVQAGNVKALAVTTPDRLAYLPDVPTMTELGYPAVDGIFWVGVFAPAGTPPEIVDYLNQVSVEAFSSEDVVSRFASQGMEFGKQTPSEFAEFIDSEKKRWAEVISVTGLTGLLP